MCILYAPIMLRWNSLHQNQPVLPSFSIATIGLGAAQCGRHAAAAHVSTSYLWYTAETHRRWNVANADMQKQSQNWILKRCSMSFAVEFRWYISWWSVLECDVSLLSCRCGIKSLAGVSCGSQWWWTREWTCILVQLGIHSLIPQETTLRIPLMRIWNYWDYAST